ncbi:MAG: hypothetical protein R2787_08235 [Saprospiraceae bacterium]
MHRFDQFRIEGWVQTDKFTSFGMLRHYRPGRTFARLILVFLVIFSSFFP